MFTNLYLAALLTALVIVIHLAGLLTLLHFLRRNAHRALGGDGIRDSLRQGAMVFTVVLGVFLLHGVEISVYGLAYLVAGAFRDFETALYFSASAFSTLGFGDVVLGPEWRLLSAVEGVSGLILIGWSSAFLLSVTSRLRLLEHEWEANAERDRKF